MIHPLRPSAHRLALLGMLALGGCSSGAEPPIATSPAETAFLKENDRAMSAMMSGMTVKATGDVDKDFALMMIPHHQGAIDMAKAYLQYGKNEELKALARDIVEKQADEIALMKRVIGDVPTPAPSKGAMDQGHDHQM
jgi:uncharacterized protein (DUF305 family)